MADPTLLRSFRFRVTLTRAGVAPRAAGPAARPATPAPPIAAQAPSGARAFRPDPPDTLGDGGFQECSGLELEMDVQEYLEGGRNDGVIKRVGRAKVAPIVLKRGMFYAPNGTVNADLWNWLQSIVRGLRPVPRYNGIVEVLSGDASEAVKATWIFERGLPAKIAGPQLNARTGEIAIEELHIAHEGLRLADGGGA